MNDTSLRLISHSNWITFPSRGMYAEAVWRQDGDPANPEVVAYLDPDMNHTKFVPNRYFTWGDVLDFFKDHPRVDI